MNSVATINGVLQELHIRLGAPTPFYLDSKSVYDVVRSDTGAKKSVWAARRTLVVSEACEHDEILPLKVGEADMLADPLSKYLTFPVWKRHMHYLLNLPGDPPDSHRSPVNESSRGEMDTAKNAIAIDIPESD